MLEKEKVELGSVGDTCNFYNMMMHDVGRSVSKQSIKHFHRE